VFLRQAQHLGGQVPRCRRPMPTKDFSQRGSPPLSIRDLSLAPHGAICTLLDPSPLGSATIAIESLSPPRFQRLRANAFELQWTSMKVSSPSVIFGASSMGIPSPAIHAGQQAKLLHVRYCVIMIATTNLARAVLGRFVYALNLFCKDRYGMDYAVEDYWIYEFAKVG